MTSAPPVIHIVDDDTSFRTAIGRLLRASGYEVALYESGDRFLKNPLGNEPGCILLDVRMPDLSGPQLQDRLAEMGNILPIVFLTGNGDIPMTVRAIKTGEPAMSNFPNYAGPLTETILLGNLAVWADGKKIEWDARHLRARNAPEVDRVVRPHFENHYSL